MSHLTDTAPPSAPQRAFLKLRAIAKPSGDDIARAYLSRQNPIDPRTKPPLPPQSVSREQQSVIRRFHHQAFAVRLFGSSGKRTAVISPALARKSRHLLNDLHALSTGQAGHLSPEENLLQAPVPSIGRHQQTGQPQATGIGWCPKNIFFLALQMIFAPNLFLLVGNLLLLLPILLRTHGFPGELLLQTAPLIRLCCNYLLPLLCGWALIAFALKRQMSGPWTILGLVSLACNSCWLVIDARIALIGASLRVCSNMTSSSWSWFVIYLAATIPFYLLFSQQSRRALTAQCANRLQNGPHEPFRQRNRHTMLAGVGLPGGGLPGGGLAEQSPGFLANRWQS